MSAKVLSEVLSEEQNGGESCESTIKRVLRHKSSREYFKDGGWTANPEEANCFNDVVEVAETCARYGLSDVELALRVHSQGADVFCTTIR